MIISKVRIIVLVLATLLLLSACAAQEAVTPEPAATVPGLESAPEEQPTAVPTAYPAPEIVAPTTPALDVDYPAAPTIAPTIDPYPGGLVWVIRPVGLQCEEGTAAGYGDLREATSTLTAAGVTVAESEMTDLMVTTSCGSPTSAHYRVQVAADDLNTALSMDWTQE